MRHVIGVDLGQVNDFTAIAVLERTDHVLPPELEAQYAAERALGARGAEERVRPSYAVRHLARLPLGTTYPRVVAEVRWLLASDALRSARLVVDATGVGRPVVDALRAAGLDPVPVTITAGQSVTHGDGGYRRVPKADLVACLAVLLQTGRLKIARALPLATALVEELKAFEIHHGAAGRDSYGAWREGAHDDLVLAVAVAAWWAEREPSYRGQDWADHRV
jgi:hypothetical protein